MMEDFIKNIKQGHIPLLKQTRTNTHRHTHKHAQVKKKSQRNEFLTACLANSFQLLPGWESCYGNTVSTKTNMGFISKRTQKENERKQDDKVGCPHRK